MFATIEVYINGMWQEISSAPVDNIQQDVDFYAESHDRVRAIDDDGHIVATS